MNVADYLDRGCAKFASLKGSGKADIFSQLEIRPAMVEAGADILRSLGVGLCCEAREIVCDVLRAALSPVDTLQVPKHAK